MRIGYHASHEQFPPSELLRFVRLAQNNGFEAVLSSDHFYPWSRQQGESGFAWSWLGAAMQSTDIPFGVVSAPGQRYHPAIIAQASATLAEMFPGRFWLGVGSGQVLNEGITGEGWPCKSLRNQRWQRCGEIIKKLWEGETITHDGNPSVEEARLYTRPNRKPLLFAAAISSHSARLAGPWADGLITVSSPVETLAEVIKAFRQAGGQGKPVYLKIQLSYARKEEEALDGAWEQWRTNIFGSEILTDLRLPEYFETASQVVSKEQMRETVLVSADLARHARWLKGYARLGFDHIFLHNVNKNQRVFIEDFGQKVLPELKIREKEHQ